MDVREVEFMLAKEKELSSKFMEQGYVIQAVDDRALLDVIQKTLVDLAVSYLGCESPSDPTQFLDTIHERVNVESLNDFRLALFKGLNEHSWARPAYYSLARSTLNSIVGNELAMQKRVNLSIQLPNDSSSLLPTHSDVWSGDSPFEVVLWLPLVNCYRTKSMFLLPPEADKKHSEQMHKRSSSDDLFKEIEPDVQWMEVPYGSCLIFTHTLMHGNRVNTENDSRWSMNCRFKSIFSPYSSKRLGEFFEPVSIRPATRIGMNYELPGGFKE